MPVDEDSVSVQRVWDRFVEAALNQEVDAVVLTGDLVGDHLARILLPGRAFRGLAESQAGDAADRQQQQHPYLFL